MAVSLEDDDELELDDEVAEFGLLCRLEAAAATAAAAAMAAETAEDELEFKPWMLLPPPEDELEDEELAEELPELPMT